MNRRELLKILGGAAIAAPALVSAHTVGCATDGEVISCPEAFAPAAVYGSALLTGATLFVGAFGKGCEFLDMMTLLACHRLDAIDSVTLGGKALKIAANGISATHGGNVYFESLYRQSRDDTFAAFKHGTPSNGDLVRPNWAYPVEFLPVGLTITLLRLRYDPQFFADGVPEVHYSVRGRGDIADPRRKGNLEYSANPALCMADLLSRLGHKVLTEPLIKTASECGDVGQIEYTPRMSPVDVLESMAKAGNVEVWDAAGALQFERGA